MVYIFLANGFEEIEALTPCDLMRRAAGASTEFALELVRFLRGEEAARAVAEKICWHG